MSSTAAPPERPGLPWDHEPPPGGHVQAALETSKLVLLNPVTAFRQMKTSGGVGRPLLYAAALGALGTVIASAWQLVMVVLLPRLGMGAAGAASPFGSELGGPVMVQVIMTVVFTVLSPLIIAVSLFVNSGIVHLSALIFGADKAGFEATFRVLAYSQGSTWALNLVPFLGALVAGIWALVASIIGLSEAHGITAGKATLVVLAPLAVCCVCIAVPLAMFAAAGVAAALSGVH